MRYKITGPEKIRNTITLPASKSISNRALVICALAGSEILPENLSDCDDTNVMLAALKEMPEEIDIKAAGTAMRFLTAYLAVTPGEHVITGTDRMKHRPIGVLVDALRYLGARIEYMGEEGFPPLRIVGGRHEGGHLEIASNVSSQYISALLMIGPVLKKGLQLRLQGDIISRPYIDLTLWIMRSFGAEAEWSDVDLITVKPRPYLCKPYRVESDWSAASYWYEMLALNGDKESELLIEGLSDNSRQGDSIARYLFSMLGIKTFFEDSGVEGRQNVRLKKNPRVLPRLDYDFINSPDLAQTFVATCAAMNIPFRFTGLGTLKMKETDRIEALKAEMRKLGYVIKSEDDTMLYWDGQRCEADMSAGIDTYEDHRMAMAFAPLAQKFDGLTINNPQVVTKSYPAFWDDIRSAGFTIEEEGE